MVRCYYGTAYINPASVLFAPQAMKTQREARMAEIFIRTMKKQGSPSLDDTVHNAPAIPPIGEAVAWLRREKQVFKRCLELVKAHPVLIYDDSTDCLWEFLQPILTKCAKDPSIKRSPPSRAFFLGEHQECEKRKDR